MLRYVAGERETNRFLAESGISGGVYADTAGEGLFYGGPSLGVVKQGADGRVESTTESDSVFGVAKYNINPVPAPATRFSERKNRSDLGKLVREIVNDEETFFGSGDGKNENGRIRFKT